MHYDAVRTEGKDGSGTLGDVWDQNIDFLVTFSEKIYYPPCNNRVSALTYQQEVYLLGVGGCLDELFAEFRDRIQTHRTAVVIRESRGVDYQGAPPQFFDFLV